MRERERKGERKGGKGRERQGGREREGKGRRKGGRGRARGGGGA